MMQIRCELVGGPLDGAVALKEVPSGQFLDTYWIGPDPTRPKTHIIVYELEPDSPDKVNRKILFSRKLTDSENLRRGHQA